jgi:hypothetical protein
MVDPPLSGRSDGGARADQVDGLSKRWQSLPPYLGVAQFVTAVLKSQTAPSRMS